MFVKKSEYQRVQKESQNWYRNTMALEKRDRDNREAAGRALNIKSITGIDSAPTWQTIMVEIGRLSAGSEVKINKCKKS